VDVPLLDGAVGHGHGHGHEKILAKPAWKDKESTGL
jgi:hypothetical protein